jgi:hypothetical protein
MLLSIFMGIFSIALIIFGIYHLTNIVPIVAKLWNTTDIKLKALGLLGMLCSSIELAWGIHAFIEYVIL